MVTFALCQVLVPAVRFSADHPLSPKNWALFLFAVQLVVIPVLLIVGGPARGSLPRLPSDIAINAASLLQTVALLSFVLGVVIVDRARSVAPSFRTGTIAARIPGWLFVFAFAMGIFGIYLRFHDPSGLLAYFSGESPITYDLSGPVRGLATTAQSASALFLPFLGVAFALVACRAIDIWQRGGARSPRYIGTGIVILVGLAASYAVYNYNRGAVVIPIIAMIATFSVRHRRIPLPFLGAIAVVLLGALLTAGSFRSGYLLARAGATAPLADSTDVAQIAEVYGQGPQFLGYLLDNVPQQGVLLWGGSMAASALSPVPVIGKAYRTTSGTAIYNQMIYGATGTSDQIIPFAGELILNFSLPGVVLGFALLGAAVAWINRWAHNARSTLGTYTAHFVGLWVGFLVIASVGVLSQMLIYLCAPLLSVLWAYTLYQRPSTGLRPAGTPQNLGR
jgi:hypothetical protein